MIRNRYNQVPEMMQDIVRKSDKNTKNITHMRAKRATLSQLMITRLPGTDKTAQQRQSGNLKKRSTSKTLLESFYMLNGTNLVLKSYMDQDTQTFCSHERSLTYPCIISNTQKPRQNEDK